MVVDAVITWVDGNDPAHKVKMEDYLENKKSISKIKAKLLSYVS